MTFFTEHPAPSVSAYRKETRMHTHGHGDGPSMNQSIFDIGLSVETISVYLLVCGLTDAGRKVTTKNVAEVWNGTDQALDQGLQELEGRRIIRRILSDGKENSVFKVLDIQRWKVE